MLTLPEPPIDAPYDPQFDTEKSLCLRINGAVSICIGVCPEEEGCIAFVGFLKTGGRPDRDDTREHAVRVAGKFMANQFPNEPWYVWDWLADLVYDDCPDPSVAKNLARKLIAMRAAFQQEVGRKA